MKLSIVTGAGGFLGSHLVERLLSQGQAVVGIDNFSTGSPENLTFLKTLGGEFHFIEADVSQPWTWLPEAVKLSGGQIEWIFHFASPASPPHYQRLALETMQANGNGLWNALQAADSGGGRVVFASTSEVYGDPEVSPQPETYWGRVNSFGERACYDEAKRFGEALVFSWNKRHGTRHGLVRIFNTYGPRMNPDDGRVVINFIQQALRGENLTVYGDGSQTRSFCYVDDLVDGVLRYAASSQIEPVNIGNDKEFSILELARIVQETLQGGPIEHRPLPADDPRRRKPDLSRARERLSGWEPRVSLREGLPKLATWLQQSGFLK